MLFSSVSLRVEIRIAAPLERDTPTEYEKRDKETICFNSWRCQNEYVVVSKTNEIDKGTKGKINNKD